MGSHDELQEALATYSVFCNSSSEDGRRIEFMSNLSAGSGPLNAKIWIIGEAYGETEKKNDEPFVGKMGLELRKKLITVGINEEDVHFDNVVNYQPPKNNFRWFLENEQGRKILDEGVRELKDRIRNYKPNIIVCCGVQPLTYIMGKGSPIKSWRGHVFYLEELGVKAICTYHPSAYVRQRFVRKDTKKDEHPGQFEALFFIDLQRAALESQFPEAKFAEFESIISPSFEEAEDFLIKAKEAEELSYDIETLGRNYNFMDCIGLATRLDQGICIPFYIPQGGIKPKRYWSSPLEEARIFQLLKELLESDVPKVAQNSQFDTLILGEYYGINIRNLIWDTLVAAHCIYCDLPKDFGTLLSLYTHLPYQKYLIKTGSVVDRWEYNVADAVGNLHIKAGELEELKEAGTLHHFRTVSMPLIPVLVDMQRKGVRVDEPLRNEVMTMEEAKMNRLLDAFDKVAPDLNKDKKKFPHKFNPGSWQQKQQLFYTVLKTRAQYNKGKLSTDETAMSKIIERDHREFVRVLAEGCIEYRKAQSMYSKLNVPLREGRIHTAYNAAGTDTGRLSSSESDLGGGTNLQNLSKGPQRRMLIPDEGKRFCYVDLWGAEAFLTFLDAAEPEGLDLLKKGVKIHNFLWDHVKENFPQEMKERFGEDEAEAYHKMKQAIHAMNYNAQIPIMVKETGLPRNVCEWIYHWYHGKFPGIKRRIERITDEIKRTRRLESFLGRQRLFAAPLSQDLYNSAYAWPSQSTIGEITNVAITKIAVVGRSREPSMFPLLNTHDGAVIQFQRGAEREVRERVKDAFAIPVRKHGITITIPIELGFAENFNDIEDEEIIRYD